jgi:hypothetical protein
MKQSTLEQAVRDALESEQAATRFLKAMAAHEADGPTRRAYRRLAEHACENAGTLERIVSRIEEGELASYAEIILAPEQDAPGWELPRAAGSDLCSIARDFAYQAAIFYALLAEAAPLYAPGFRELANRSEELAHRLQESLRAPDVWAPARSE